jgi:deoxyribonuclease-1
MYEEGSVRRATLLSATGCLLLWLIASGAGPASAAGWDSVTLSDSVVAFGAVTTGEPNSLEMSITNWLSEPVAVTGVAFTGEVFSTDLECGDIPPMSTCFFNVYFSGEQNIDYTDFLQIDVVPGVRPLVAEVTAEAHHPGTYYSSTRNLWAEDLKSELTSIIDDHTSLGYTLARDYMYGQIDNDSGWVECVYTGRRAFFNTRLGATENGFNCEHTWPQSFSNEAEPMKSDLYHLYPTDETANNKRGNLDFGIVNTVTWSVGGSKLGYDSESQLVFEPRDVHKGNVARTHFYYIIRYDGNYNEYVDPGKMEAHFREWHVSDPVDADETARNEAIYALQNNRNPFIDHPEFVDRISSFFGTAVRVMEPEIAVCPVPLDMGTVGLDSTHYCYLAVINSGDDSLHVSSISSSDPGFLPGRTCAALGPKTFTYVSIGYTSGGVETDDSTTVSLASDDADEGLVEVRVNIRVRDLAGVERDDTAPAGLRLAQNSPNPFRARTTIEFGLPSASAVDLSVYNIRGQLVATLLEADRVSPGAYRVDFDAGGLPSGVYYCRLTAAGRTETRRMVLIH